MAFERHRDEAEGGGAPTSARASAIELMRRALVVLDREGPLAAAATLALAIEQAGGTVDPPFAP